MKSEKYMNLNRKIEIVKNVLSELLNYLLIFSVEYVFLTDFFKYEPDRSALLLLVLIPLFYYFVREKFSRFFLFFFCHFLPPVALILFYRGYIAQKGVMLTAVLIMMALSISRRFSEYTWGMEAAMPPAAVATYVVLYLLDAGEPGGRCAAFLLHNVLYYIAGYFLYYFLKQFLRYVDVNNRTTDHIPVNHIFYSAAGLAVGFTAIGSGTALLTANRDLMEKAGEAIQNALIRLILFLASFIPERETEQEVLLQQDMSAGVSLMDLLGAGEASLLAKIMDILFSILAICVTGFVLTGFILGIVKLIKATFRRKQLTQTAQDDGHKDKVESIIKKEEKKAAGDNSGWKRFREAFTPAERIRRLYRRVLSGAVHIRDNDEKSRLIERATARECLTGLFPDTLQEAIEFAKIYEKARYGKECTSQDLKIAKALADKLKQVLHSRA